MSFLHKRISLMLLTALMLIHPSHTKTEPITLVLAGGAGFVGCALLTYLCSETKEEIPSPELATAQAEGLREKLSIKHHCIVQASNKINKENFRKTLNSHFTSATQVNKQVTDLHSSLESIDQAIKQLNKVGSSNKELTLTQKNKLIREEKLLKQSRKELAHALQRFSKNEKYFKLHAQLHELQEGHFVSNKMHPRLDQEKHLRSKLDKINSIHVAAKRLGYTNIEERASSIYGDVRRTLHCLIESDAYKREHSAQLEHNSRVQCQKLHNAELERQADLDRQVRRQEIATQKQKNALLQQRLELEEGLVAQRIENQFRSRLAQEKNKLRQSQDSLRQSQRALDKSLAREADLRNKLNLASKTDTEKTHLIAALQRELKKLQAREREKYRCDVEGCSRENCSIHPKPSAPPVAEEEGCTGGPPQAAYGVTPR